MNKLTGFGEIMGRFAPEGFLRFAQAMPGKMNLSFGGAEANVCASIAVMGGNASFVTALPRNPLAESCIAFLRSLNVGTEKIIRTSEGRLGLYFLESGANQRPSNVVYDRENSAVAIVSPDTYDWDKIFDGSSWFHISGITPAISESAARASIMAVKKAKERKMTVSCDLNFRKKLWNWDSSLKPRELAEKTMREILPYTDIAIANEEDAADVLGIHAGATDVHSGKLEIAKYPEVAAKMHSQFKNISKIAITLRESISATHNNWGAMLYDAISGKPYFAPLSNAQYTPYEIRNIVDRVGGGDSFAAGLIYALMDKELSSPQTAIAFAAAASCLAHSILGDTNYVNRKEVEALMNGSGSGRVTR
ncbi:MAG: carbohydrate kinase [Lentisphaerae bacterium GWF2_52_8]|nr:MAG: carbohydrate kinase [Lentisphaerae bacterium GWF2_52_8]